MANVRIRNAGQEREEEPMISQRSMKKLMDQKDNQYKEMRRSLIESRQEIEHQALTEGKGRIIAELEVDRLRGLAKLQTVLLAISMAANIGLVAFYG